MCASPSSIFVTVPAQGKGLNPSVVGHPDLRLQTQARSIIQMSDEQNSQYVGMLYCVDLNIWPLCSSTCSEPQHKQSFAFYLHVSGHIYICVSYPWACSYLVIANSKLVQEE